ncbi:DUF1828 domain-containing protein [Povalibacter sp.]|uniref:DUF1828 domain-containing protein n=1 Tax=Povalibacter sp. TaxID=1962978 RepID=UPI002F3FF284
MKAELCKAFCEDVTVNQVPFGLAVGTGFAGPMGDPIGFYVSNPDRDGRRWIQDDGLTIFNLESAGADISLSSRAQAFRDLLNEYGLEFDEDEQVLRSSPLHDDELPKKALSFVAFMLRLQDLTLLVKERVASTFKEEVIRELRARVGDRATILEDAPVSLELAQYPADVVLQAVGSPPVALFFGTSDANLSEAIILDLVARHEVMTELSVIALLETENQPGLSKKIRQRASNRLTAVPSYRGDEGAALDRIVRETLRKAS